MTTPALNATFSIKERINGTANGYSHKEVNGQTANGSIHTTNGVNGADHQTKGIVKEKPFNTGRGRPVRVVCIGAGAAGIYLGLKLPRTISADLCELQIYEKNPKFGGCWYENRYPGCACDIPSHVYSYSFAPNPDWSHFYSSASEIQKYFEGVAHTYNVQKLVKFEHKVTEAIWNEEGRWDLKIQTPEGQVIDDHADMLINASGILNNWKWPDIEGLKTFKGPMLHSANWDDGVELSKDKKVAVIGNGSSAIQIVPRLQPKVQHIDTYIRTKTWIALPFTSESVKQKAIDAGSVNAEGAAQVLIDPETSNPAYTEEERRNFRENPAELRRYRKNIENENNSRFAGSTIKGTPGAEAAIPRLTQIMKQRLEKKPELAELLIPDWHVGCRRLTPGVGYLEALCEDNVSVVTTGISRIVPEGIETSDGQIHPCDVLICATGFDVSTRPRFNVVGRDGHVFTDKWAKNPSGYLTLAMSNMPNYFIFNGPNAPIANGSLIPAMEKEGDYMINMIEKMIREDIRSMCIRKEAEDEFTAYTDAWMPRSIWSSGCRSWYKGGTINGRVTGLWPGSILHFMNILKNPRYEDYEYTYLDSRNRYSFFGNGFTLADLDSKADHAPYLDTAFIEP